MVRLARLKQHQCSVGSDKLRKGIEGFNSLVVLQFGKDISSYDEIKIIVCS
jgi:hypothetical protein